MKINKKLVAIVGSLCLVSILIAIYLNYHKVIETCSSSSIYANCVHYRYSEFIRPLQIFTVFSAVYLLASFIIKKARILKIVGLIAAVLYVGTIGFFSLNDNRIKDSTPAFPKCYAAPNGLGELCE